MPTIVEGIDASTGLDTIYSLQIGDTFSGSVEGSDEVDRVLFSLTAGETYTASLTGLYGGSSSGSFSLANFDQGVTSWSLSYADGSAVGQIGNLQIEDTGTGWNVTFVAPLTGEYSLVVDDNGDNAAGAYEMSLFAGATAPAFTQRTVVDTDNTKIWESFTDTFDALGVRIRRDMTFDDGRNALTNYESGVRTSSTTTDGENANIWSFFTDTFDASGDRIERDMTFDDGRNTVTTYENGVRSAATTTDGSGTKSWSYLTDTFDPSGALTQRDMFYDNGNSVRELYENGILVTSTTWDGSTAAWNSVKDSFDAAGTQTQRILTYDDGRQATTTFENGIRSQMTVEDLGDAFEWHSQVTEYDETGQVVSFTSTPDPAGDLEIIRFDGGLFLDPDQYKEGSYILTGDIAQIANFDNDLDKEFGVSDAMPANGTGILISIEHEAGAAFSLEGMSTIVDLASDVDLNIGLRGFTEDGTLLNYFANDAEYDDWTFFNSDGPPYYVQVTEEELYEDFTNLTRLDVQVYWNTGEDSWSNGFAFDDLLLVAEYYDAAVDDPIDDQPILIE